MASVGSPRHGGHTPFRDRAFVVCAVGIANAWGCVLERWEHTHIHVHTARPEPNQPGGAQPVSQPAAAQGREVGWW